MQDVKQITGEEENSFPLKIVVEKLSGNVYQESPAGSVGCLEDDSCE